MRPPGQSGGAYTHDFLVGSPDSCFSPRLHPATPGSEGMPAMIDLSIYSSIANPPRGDDLDRCMAEAIHEAEVAEAAGFSGFFVGEHHQDKDGFLPSPFVVLAAIAARTHQIRVGTAVLLLPLHHPIRVAEDAAVLDIVSGGRAVLGVGLGYQEADFRAIGIDRHERVPRFEESIAILRQAWTGRPISHKGRAFDIDGVRVTPRPLQRPGIPVWVGGWVPAAVERAGRLGDALVLGPSFTLEENRALVAHYRAAAEAAGKTPQIVLMRDAWVADSFEEAARIYGTQVSDAYRYYWRNGAIAFRGFASEAELRFEAIWKDRIILGAPEACIAAFKHWSDVLGVTSFMLRLRHAHSGGPPHRKIVKAIERFGRDVIPHL